MKKHNSFAHFYNEYNYCFIMRFFFFSGGGGKICSSSSKQWGCPVVLSLNQSHAENNYGVISERDDFLENLVMNRIVWGVKCRKTMIWIFIQSEKSSQKKAILLAQDIGSISPPLKIDLSTETKWKLWPSAADSVLIQKIILCNLQNTRTPDELFQGNSLTKPEFILKVPKADPIVTPLPGEVCQAVLTTLEYLNTRMWQYDRVRKIQLSRDKNVQTK